MKEVWLLNEGSSDSVAAPQGSTPGETVLMLCCSGQGRESRNQGISLSLLQGIFPTQELNWGLLHCRWILYQLSYQGSVYMSIPISQFIPSRFYPLGKHKFVFYICDSISVL